MSKDARVRRNGRHRRSLVQRAVFNDDPQQPNSLVDMSHIFACADAAICAENSTAPALGDPFLWGVLSRIPNMIPFLATPARPRAQALNDTPAANVSAANASAVMDEAPGADAPKPSSAFWRLMTRCFTGACGEASGTSTEGCGAVAHSTGAQVQPAQPQLPALTGEEINDQLVDVLMQTIEGAAWEEICDADGIRVCRTKLSADTLIGGRPVGSLCPWLISIFLSSLSSLPFILSRFRSPHFSNSPLISSLWSIFLSIFSGQITHSWWFSVQPSLGRGWHAILCISSFLHR